MAKTRLAGPETETPLRDLPGAALRAVFREGYGLADLKHDVLAGLVVGVVALPLAMALSIAVGTPPQNGLYTAIVAGFLVALLGGSRTQVTGPTAAFVVILAPIQARFGLEGLLLSGLMAGGMLVLMGALRLGRLIEFIPHPVTTGFTAGIAVVIATLQIKDLFGLTLASAPDHYAERVHALWSARGTASGAAFAVGAGTLLLLVLVPKITRRVPAPLLVLSIAAVAAFFLAPAHPVETIASRFETRVGGEVVRGIPQLPPMPLLPWRAPGPGGEHLPLTFDTFQALFGGAFAIAMLGAIESLLSAVVADGMAGTRHDPDAELMAQGIGNLVCPFFGGIPATGAIARTATNIRSGARSPVSAMVHALTVLAAVLALAPLLGWLPMAALAALLILVAWNMSEARHFVHTLKVAPKSDVAVLLVCFGLTVFFDMVIAVSVGVTLAALLFMRRMSEVTRADLLSPGDLGLPHPPPSGVLVYDIAGPLFFGAAQRAMGALQRHGGDGVRAVVLRMDQVPVMDATGLVALESALGRLQKRGCLTVISGMKPQPRRLLEKSAIEKRYPALKIAGSLDQALRLAEKGAEPAA